MLGYSNMDICFVEMLKFVVPLFKGVFFGFWVSSQGKMENQV